MRHWGPVSFPLSQSFLATLLFRKKVDFRRPSVSAPLHTERRDVRCASMVSACGATPGAPAAVVGASTSAGSPPEKQMQPSSSSTATAKEIRIANSPFGGGRRARSRKQEGSPSRPARQLPAQLVEKRLPPSQVVSPELHMQLDPSSMDRKLLSKMQHQQAMNAIVPPRGSRRGQRSPGAHRAPASPKISPKAKQKSAAIHPSSPKEKSEGADQSQVSAPTATSPSAVRPAVRSAKQNEAAAVSSSRRRNQASQEIAASSHVASHSLLGAATSSRDAGMVSARPNSSARSPTVLAESAVASAAKPFVADSKKAARRDTTRHSNGYSMGAYSEAVPDGSSSAPSRKTATSNGYAISIPLEFSNQPEDAELVDQLRKLIAQEDALASAIKIHDADKEIAAELRSAALQEIAAQNDVLYGDMSEELELVRAKIALGGARLSANSRRKGADHGQPIITVNANVDSSCASSGLRANCPRGPGGYGMGSCCGSPNCSTRSSDQTTAFASVVRFFAGLWPNTTSAQVTRPVTATSTRLKTPSPLGAMAPRQAQLEPVMEAAEREITLELVSNPSVDEETPAARSSSSRTRSVPRPRPPPPPPDLTKSLVGLLDAFETRQVDLLPPSHPSTCSVSATSPQKVLTLREHMHSQQRSKPFPNTPSSTPPSTATSTPSPMTPTGMRTPPQRSNRSQSSHRVTTRTAQ